MKKIIIIALISLGIVSLEAKGGSAGGAFAGSLIGSSMGTAISNNNRDGGNCERHEEQIEKYEDKNEELRRRNNTLSKLIKPHRGKFKELEDDFEEVFNNIDEDL